MNGARNDTCFSAGVKVPTFQILGPTYYRPKLQPNPYNRATFCAESTNDHSRWWLYKENVARNWTGRRVKMQLFAHQISGLYV